jgi:hypothetical protein
MSENHHVQIQPCLLELLYFKSIKLSLLTRKELQNPRAISHEGRQKEELKRPRIPERI